MKKLFILCPLCSESIELKKSRKGKPYAACKACELMLFINGERGLQHLKSKILERDEGVF